MKIIIQGTAKEIAGLVVRVQGRPELNLEVSDAEDLNVIEYLPDGSTVQHKKGGFPCDAK